MPKNRQHYRKIKYPDKVTKQKRLVFVRIFLFSSVGSRNAYFPTAPFIFVFYCSFTRVAIFFTSNKNSNLLVSFLILGMESSNDTTLS